MSRVAYPKGIKPMLDSTSKNKKANTSRKPYLQGHGNRGMDFENDLNSTNEYYTEKGIALITKRPTPINVVKVDYTKGAIITQAFFQTQSTTDCNGVYRGQYIDFEAKSTRSTTSFPLANIPPQQIAHLERVIEQKGWAFFLIDFASLNEVYFLPASYVIEFYRSRPRGSIPLNDIKEHGSKIKEGFSPRYDYLTEAIKYFEKK